jgi:hypothetical protein
VGSLIGLIVTLKMHERRTIPEWPYKLTINSIISLFILVLKTSALVVLCEGISQLKWTWFSRTRPLSDIAAYDDASRGPWGALVLMWTLRHRHLSSSLAAFIMLAALLLDPMGQQLVEYYSCDQALLNTTATFPRTQFLGGIETSDYVSDATAAIKSGLYAQNPVPIDFDCPTGQCSFQQRYGTIGWCSHCEDVSEKVVFNTVKASNNKTSWITATLPSGSFGQTMNDTTSIQLAVVTKRDPSQAGMTTDFISVTFPERRLNKTSYDSDCPPYNQTTGSWCSNGFGAATCQSYICAREFNASVSEGHLQEIELSRTTIWTNMNSFFTYQDSYRNAIRLSCLTSEQRGKLKSYGYDITPEMTWVPYNGSVTDPTDRDQWPMVTRAVDRDGLTYVYYASNRTTVVFDYRTDTRHSFIKATNEDTIASIVPQECIYGFEPGMAGDVQRTSLMPSLDGQYGWQRQNLGSSSNSSRYLGKLGPVSEVMAKLSRNKNVEFGDVEKVYMDATSALDRFARQAGNAKFSAPANGTIYSKSTCLRLNEGWFAVPAAFTALLLLFFLTLVLETVPTQRASADQQLHNFKASPLALLFHGFDDNTLSGLDRQSASDDRKELEKLAKTMRVRLVRSQDGWKFSEDDTGSADSA